MTNTLTRTKVVAVLIGLISAAAFGVATPLSKMFVQEMNPFLLAGLFYLGAGIGLIPFGIVGLKDISAVRLSSNYRLLGGMVLFGGILGPVFLLMAIRLASATSVSLWLNLELVATATLGFFVFKDHLDKRGWAGVVLSVIAGGILSYGGGANGILAGLLVMLACVCWGIDNHCTALIGNLSPVQSTIIKGLCAGGTNFIIGLMLSNGRIGSSPVVSVMLVGFLCYGVSIVLYIYSAQRLGAVRSQMLFSIAPFFGVLFSMFLLKESLSAVQMISGLLLAGSVGLILTERHEHAHEHAEMEHVHQHDHDDLHHEHHEGVVQGAHSHFHKHAKTRHVHPHAPDLHHRHVH